MVSNGKVSPVALDTLGGDHGVRPLVEGAIAACKEYSVPSILIGPESEIVPILKQKGALNLGLEVVDCSESISMSESPGKAVRRKPGASVCVAYQLVKEGRACGALSAGNTGAMMVAGRLILGLQPGIERPAITMLLPVLGEQTPNVILDVGANVDCHAHNLIQFAVMGSIYRQSLFPDEKPVVGLLSNGAEESKGTDVIRAAAVELQKYQSINYVGYVEGRDVASKKANVIVCDGFVGNVMLKSMEGAAQLIGQQLKLSSRKRPVAKFGMWLAKGVLRSAFKEKFDYSTYGGAPLLGLGGLGVVLHGSSDSRAVKNAIRVGSSFADVHMVDRISEALTRLEEETDDADFVGGFGVSSRAIQPVKKKPKKVKSKVEKVEEDERPEG